MGVEEEASACPQAAALNMEVIRTPGGHHFDGNHAVLAELIRQGILKRMGNN